MIHFILIINFISIKKSTYSFNEFRIELINASSVFALCLQVDDSKSTRGSLLHYLNEEIENALFIGKMRRRKKTETEDE